MNETDEKKISTPRGFSEKEFNRIQELVKTKLEQGSQLEYEQYESYEVPPGTYFSMLKKPAASIKYGQIAFNMACIRLFEGVEYILPMLSEKKQSLLVVMCKEEESSSVAWARVKDDRWVNKNVTSPDFVEDIFKIMEDWDRKARFKAIGQLVMTDRGLGLRFDLKEAVMFDAKPEEYIDPKTGETKKRRIKYYPDQYKERYGKTYSDYMASHPTQDYEPFDDYITSSLGKTYSDVMKDRAKAEAAKTETMENPAGNLPGAYLGGNDDAGTAISETGSVQTDNIL